MEQNQVTISQKHDQIWKCFYSQMLDKYDQVVQGDMQCLRLVSSVVKELHRCNTMHVNACQCMSKAD